MVAIAVFFGAACFVGGVIWGARHKGHAEQASDAYGKVKTEIEEKL